MTDPTSATPTPSITVSVTLVMPSSMVLPVQRDVAGNQVPSTGFVWQKYIDRAQLDAWGVQLTWQDAKGNVLPQDVVDQLIAQAEARELTPNALREISSHDPS